MRTSAPDGQISATELSSLVPPLRPYPAIDEKQVPDYPGQLDGPLFVRRTPTAGADATHAFYVHGMGGNSRNFTDLMYLLEPYFPGVALDLPGYGFSEPSADGKYSIRRNARAVITVLDTMGGKPVHLMGNSLGGATSVWVAATRPDLVKSLTLFSPAMLTRAVMTRYHLPQAWAIVDAGRQAKKMTLDQRATAATRTTRDLVYGDPSRMSKQRFDEAVIEAKRRLQLEHSPDVLNQSAVSLLAHAGQRAKNPRNIWQIAGHVAAPTLGIFGTKDRLIPVELVPKICAAIPGCTANVHEGWGHVAMMEYPEESAREVLSWLATLAI